MANPRQWLYPNLRRGRDGKTIRQESVKDPSTRTRGLKRGGSPGRPKGVQNKVTREVQALAQGIIEDPAIRFARPFAPLSEHKHPRGLLPRVRDQLRPHDSLLRDDAAGDPGARTSGGIGLHVIAP